MSSGQPGRLHHAKNVWLPTTHCGIATCLNRAIGTTGLAPVRLRPSRPLHARLQLADLTVLFADIAGITEIFAQYPAEEALNLLYECMGDMTQSIVDTGGTIEGYHGDEIVAFWGAPVPTTDHAVQGCLAAPGHPGQGRRAGCQVPP